MSTILNNLLHLYNNISLCNNFVFRFSLVCINMTSRYFHHKATLVYSLPPHTTVLWRLWSIVYKYSGRVTYQRLLTHKPVRKIHYSAHVRYDILSSFELQSMITVNCLAGWLWLEMRYIECLYPGFERTAIFPPPMYCVRNLYDHHGQFEITYVLYFVCISNIDIWGRITWNLYSGIQWTEITSVLPDIFQCPWMRNRCQGVHYFLIVYSTSCSSLYP